MKDTVGFLSHCFEMVCAVMADYGFNGSNWNSEETMRTGKHNSGQGLTVLEKVDEVIETVEAVLDRHGYSETTTADEEIDRLTKAMWLQAFLDTPVGKKAFKRNKTATIHIVLRGVEWDSTMGCLEHFAKTGQLTLPKPC